MSEEVTKYKVSKKTSDLENLLESAYANLIEAHKLCALQNGKYYNKIGKIIDQIEELFIEEY